MKPADKPVEINERRLVSIPLPILVFLIGLIITATMGWAALRTDTQEAKTATLLNAARITTLEQSMSDIATVKRDVEWIKKTLDEDRSNRRNGLGSP